MICQYSKFSSVAPWPPPEFFTYVPVGPALFYIKGVCPTAIKTRDIYTGVFPFIIIQLLVLFAVFVLDDLATWLPDIIHN